MIGEGSQPLRPLTWIKKPFQLLDRIGERIFNYCAANPFLAILKIYILVAITVFFNFYLNQDGLVWGDAPYYLSTAKIIANGQIWENGISGAFEKMNPQWPFGYPLLIGFVSNFLGLNVFWSSKALNLILVAITMGILHKWLYPFGWVYSLCFLSAAMIDMVSLTWSETPFLAVLVILIFLISKVHKNYEWSGGYLVIGFVLGFLFLIRYIGGSAFLAVLISMFLYFKNMKCFWGRLLIVFSVAGCLSVSYMLCNYFFTGFIFGDRVITLNDPIELGKTFLSSFFMLLAIPVNINFNEFKWIILVLIFEILIFIYFYFNKSKEDSFIHHKRQERFYLFAKIFMVCYLVLIIIARSIIYQNELFSSRILLPAFLLGFLGFLNYLYSCKYNCFYSLVKPLILIMIGSFFLNLPVKLGYRYLITDHAVQTYSDKLKVITSKYSDIPKKEGVVINGSRHLFYRVDHLKPLRLGPLLNADDKFNDNYLNNLLNKHQQVLIHLNANHHLITALKKEGFLLDSIHEKGILTMYKIKQSS